MPSPESPDTIKNLLPNSEGNQCDNFMKALLAIPTKFWRILNWMFTSAGNVSVDFRREVVKTGDLIFSASPLLEDDNRLLCNGRELARVGTYAPLFNAIGTVYGDGDGSTTFNLPDYRGRFPVGVGTTQNLDADLDEKAVDVDLGGTGGSSEIKLVEGELPRHRHGGNFALTSGSQLAGGSDLIHSASYTGYIGNDEYHQNLPPYMGCFIYIAT